MPEVLGVRIRRLRRRLGWTLQHLADHTGFTRSFISKIETGKTVPPAATVMKLAAALGVPAAALMEEQEGRRTVFTSAIAGKSGMVQSDKGYLFRMLAAKREDKCMQPILFEARHGRITPQKLTHGGEEFVFMLEGKMAYQVGEESFELGPGDSLYFDAEQPHELQPITRKVRFLALFSEAAALAGQTKKIGGGKKA